MVFHVPEFLSLYGNLIPFSQQGLEKLNDHLTKDYFSSTSHQEQNALQQLMLKLNRLEELNDKGADQRQKQVHYCEICKKAIIRVRVASNLNVLVSGTYVLIILLDLCIYL